MIYLGFLFDYLVMLFLPIDTFFVVLDLDKNRFLSVLFIGMLLDIMYHKLFINLFILVVFYFISKNINKFLKKSLFRNIVIYFLYFNLMYFSFGYNHNYFFGFLVGIVLQVFYLKLTKVLLK